MKYSINPMILLILAVTFLVNSASPGGAESLTTLSSTSRLVEKAIAELAHVSERENQAPALGTYGFEASLSPNAKKIFDKLKRLERETIEATLIKAIYLTPIDRSSVDLWHAQAIVALLLQLMSDGAYSIPAVYPWLYSSEKVLRESGVLIVQAVCVRAPGLTYGDDGASFEERAVPMAPGVLGLAITPITDLIVDEADEFLQSIAVNVLACLAHKVEPTFKGQIAKSVKRVMDSGVQNPRLNGFVDAAK